MSRWILTLILYLMGSQILTLEPPLFHTSHYDSGWFIQELAQSFELMQ